MRTDPSFERDVAAWLEAEAPTRAPAEVLATAIDRVAGRRQDHAVAARLLGDRSARSPVLRWALLALLIVAIVAWLAVASGRRGGNEDPPVGAFGAGPELVTGRGGHTTTQLLDGRILVVGGQTHPDAWIPEPDSTELWDPAWGAEAAFVRATPLREGRAGHTATLLPDGRVLIVGGIWWDDSGPAVARRTAEIWDPETGTFRPAGTLQEGRSDHGAALLPDGRVLIAGGTSGEDQGWRRLASMEIWDPSTATFARGGDLTGVSSGHDALLLQDGRVLVIADDGTNLVDPTSGGIQPGPSLQEPRYFETATVLADGRVLVVGGMWGSNEDIVVRGSAEIWDPGAASFALLDATPLPQAGHTAVLLPDARVLIVGGDGSRAAEVWDPRTGMFAATGHTLEDRGGATATVLADGRVLIAGAMSRGGIPARTEIWDPAGRPDPAIEAPTPDAPSTPPPVPEDPTSP